MEKNYRIKNINDYICVEFSGDIDDSVCPRYKKEIGALIESNKNKDMVFDFKDVTFIDSSGIGLILARYNQLKSHRRKLYVSQTNNQIQKLFKISGIYTIIEELEKVKIGERVWIKWNLKFLQQ